MICNLHEYVRVKHLCRITENLYALYRALVQELLGAVSRYNPAIETVMLLYRVGATPADLQYLI